MTKSTEKLGLADPTTVAALVRYTGVPASSVYRVLKAAGLAVRGGVPLAAALRALVQQRADLRPQRTAIDAEQHRKLRLANDEREGRLINRSSVLRAVDSAGLTIGAEIDGFAPRVAARLNGLGEAERLAVLRDEATELRRRCAAGLRRLADPQ
jgi:hypothetical protein